MPILIAGVGLTLTLPIVARHADAWHAFFPDSIEEVQPAVEALSAHCEAIGRDPYEIEWSVGLQPDDIDRFLREDADRYLELGFTQFTLGFGGPDWSVEGGRDFLEWRDRINAEAPGGNRRLTGSAGLGRDLRVHRLRGLRPNAGRTDGHGVEPLQVGPRAETLEELARLCCPRSRLRRIGKQRDGGELPARGVEELLQVAELVEALDEPQTRLGWLALERQGPAVHDGLERLREPALEHPVTELVGGGARLRCPFLAEQRGGQTRPDERVVRLSHP